MNDRFYNFIQEAFSVSGIHEESIIRKVIENSKQADLWMLIGEKMFSRVKNILLIMLIHASLIPFSGSSSALDLKTLYRADITKPLPNAICKRAVSEGALVISEYEKILGDTKYTGNLYLLDGSFIYTAFVPYFGIAPAPHFYFKCWGYIEPE